MRFDLTNASRRVMERAARQRLPGSSSEISAAKLLLSLFAEEECRAAVWLNDIGITAHHFERAFGWGQEYDTLQSPVSAPGFPAGDYGIVPQMPQPSSADSFFVQASSAGKQPGQVGYENGEEQASEEDSAGQHSEPSPPVQEPDDFLPTAESARYSLYHHFEPNVHSRSRFYLDDIPVDFGRVTQTLESSLESMAMRLTRQHGKNNPGYSERSRHIPTAGGGITTVTDAQSRYFPSFTLTTEHLLLAAVLDESDTGRFLRDNGLDPVELFRKMGETETEPEAERTYEVPEELNGGNDEKSPVVLPLPSSFSEHSLFRILDAAVNRSREAVRVIEDFVRFVLDDSELTRQMKAFRHGFQETAAALPLHRRLDARDTEQDIGTEIEGQLEYQRSTVHDVLAANFARLQESLRSIEEYSKIAEPAAARRFEQLRYRSYTLHKIIASNGKNTLIVTKNNDAAESPASVLRQRLETVRLYALLDCRENEEQFIRTADAFISGGVGIIQLRDKSADERTILSRSKILKERIASSQRPVLFIMNDRPDLAEIAGADGVHVGQTELPVAEVRRIVGSGLLVGVSTHRLEQAYQAVADGADYIGAGPVFESATKSFSEREIAGTDYLKEIAAERFALPVFAIGGITLENLDEVLATGIRRIVLGSALLNAEEPKSAAEEFLKIIDGKAGLS